MQTNLRHCRVAKDAPEHREAASNDDVIADVLHDLSCLPGYQRQEDGSLVQVPEEEELSPASRGATHMTKQVDGRIPEHLVEA